MDQFLTFFLNHWLLWLLLVVVLILIGINEWLSHKKQAKSLSTTAVVELINNNDAVIIDLRPAEAFRAGHIINAIRADESDFHQPSMEKYKSKPVVLVCARGVQALALATKLRDQGFMNPMTLSGGIAAWQAANLPLVKGK